MIAWLLSIDHDLFLFINSHHSVFFDYFFSIITNFGNGWVVAPILLVLIFYKIPRQKRLSFFVIATVLIAGSSLANSSLKELYNRPRPLSYFSNVTSNSDSHNGITVHVVGDRLYRNSFPSGHTNTAFAAATLLALQFGGAFWWTFVMAALVGYSRIYLGVHFPSDVAAGGALGIIVLVIGMSVYKFRKSC
jgi:membrane-associated phospholipid phosphatase